MILHDLYTMGNYPGGTEFGIVDGAAAREVLWHGKVPQEAPKLEELAKVLAVRA